MKYQLVYIDKMKERVQEFDVFLDALKTAVRMREESGAQIVGIAIGKDLLKEWDYIVKTAQISAVEMVFSKATEWWKE